jgi:hypothetical protein
VAVRFAGVTMCRGVSVPLHRLVPGLVVLTGAVAATGGVMPMPRAVVTVGTRVVVMFDADFWLH